MTELFKCRKSGTQCCAPKSMIREVIEQKTQTSSPLQRNDTIQPFRPQLPPSQFHLHQPGTSIYFIITKMKIHG